ncbi:hypothetical protein [Gimesia algae]|uniref:Uncharacterized protein n=1 Tax=Gimesia algae TaxID=2527971 RepID=A0A517V7Q9_9PLAN|nr:hypothetical protein [Gimesia algae]QDT89012.1 hypothetical protein Pan161_06370 [Gimesia algae]
MKSQFEFPSEGACLLVLKKLDMDESQLDMIPQDWEYLLADETRLSDYIDLYQQPQTTDQEKRVLGCFVIQSLENLLPEMISEQRVRTCLAMLWDDRVIHAHEFEYWSMRDETDPDNLFQITNLVRAFLVERDETDSLV